MLGGKEAPRRGEVGAGGRLRKGDLRPGQRENGWRSHDRAPEKKR
jgi:hypothetical protein